MRSADARTGALFGPLLVRRSLGPATSGVRSPRPDHLIGTMLVSPGSGPIVSQRYVDPTARPGYSRSTLGWNRPREAAGAGSCGPTG